MIDGQYLRQATYLDVLAQILRQRLRCSIHVPFLIEDGIQVHCPMYVLRTGTGATGEHGQGGLMIDVLFPMW